MTNSLFDINNEHDIDGQFWQIQQTRLMHVNGLSPVSELGEIYFLNPARGVETAFPVLIKDKNITLYKRVINYNAPDVNISHLHEIKSILLQLDQLSLDIAQKEVELLVVQENNETNRSTKDESIIKIENNITKLSNNFDNNYTKFIQDQNKSGIIIAQWISSKENSFGATADSILDMQNQTSKDMSGFIIVSGLKVESLYMMDKTAKDLEENFNDSWSHRVGIITYMVSAKNFLFVNRLNHKRFLHLVSVLSTKDLNGTKKILKNLNHLTINLTMAKSDNLFSSGVYTSPQVYRCKKILNNSKLTTWTEYLDNNNSTNCNKRKESTIPFFTIFTELDELDNIWDY